MELLAALGDAEDFLWHYLGVPALVLLGLFLSFKTRFFQIRHFFTAFKIFWRFARSEEVVKGGVNPIETFFACVGGAVGVGNVVGICMAVQLGGPGALFWIWVTAIIGMILKYSEVYLGVRYRVSDGQGGHKGGPMYYLRGVMPRSVLSLIAVLLCIYGVEIYQFGVVATTISVNWGIPKQVVIVALLLSILYAGSGGVRRVGMISTVIIPLFVVLYMGMGFWVLLHHLGDLPHLLGEVLEHAFTGSAAAGGFLGSAAMVTLSQGVRRGVYTGDVGIGYAAVIHSETSAVQPEKQALLAIVDIFLDTFVVCTMSLALILATGVWNQPLDASLLVQTALGEYFPYMTFFMPFFLAILGYSTANAYFCMGLKSAEFLSPKWGRPLFFFYATVSFLFFSFVEVSHAWSLMASVGGLLLVINCVGLFMMRDRISYRI